ncbi:GIY-YIG nuclease family protein [Candidatus Parcubacteria bacterium]|nr:GIY-YIG nuclease family protein [Candidatus Parcubacteria bacterium]
MYTVYALYNSERDQIYIGQTKDLKNRLDLHRSGILKGYTSRGGGRWELVYTEEVESRQKALVREKQLKSYRGREFVRKYIPR